MPATFTLKQLRYLIAVYNERHFGRAAETCNISQPSLSAQIAQLEKILDMTLFDRSQRRVTPTQDGQKIIERARQILADCDALHAAAQSESEPLSGPLKLGVIPTLSPYYLPPVMPALRAAYPDLRLYLKEDQTDRLLTSLINGDLDAALMALPSGRRGVVEQPLFDERFLVALPHGHRLASVAAIHPDELADEDLLLLEDGHCLRDHALEVCRRADVGRAGAVPRPDGFGATSLETLREMVASRIGITLLPALAAGTRQNHLIIRPFQSPQPFRRLGLVWQRNTPRHREMELLGSFLAKNLPLNVEPLNVNQRTAV